MTEGELFFEKLKSGSTEILCEEPGFLFHCGLGSYVNSIKYDWHDCYGQIWAGGPVDMSGSIKLFEAIDKRVKFICAYLDGKPDVAYRKCNGKWEVGDLGPRPKLQGAG